MYQQGPEITLKRINNKCLQSPASDVMEIQERSPFSMQSPVVVPGPGFRAPPWSFSVPARTPQHLLCEVLQGEALVPVSLDP